MTIYNNDVFKNLHSERKEYEKTINDLTPQERIELLEWVDDGNRVYDNPYCMFGEDGSPMDFVKAYRITIDMLDNPQDYDFGDDKSISILSVKTRRDRKRSLEVVLSLAIAIRDAEEQFMNNVPENLCGSANYEIAEQAVSTLNEIIDLMDEVY